MYLQGDRRQMTASRAPCTRALTRERERLVDDGRQLVGGQRDDGRRDDHAPCLKHFRPPFQMRKPSTKLFRSHGIVLGENGISLFFAECPMEGAQLDCNALNYATDEEEMSLGTMHPLSITMP